jgi:hypothetical protein
MSGPWLPSAGIALKASTLPSADHAAGAPAAMTLLRMARAWPATGVGAADGEGGGVMSVVAAGEASGEASGEAVAPDGRVGLGEPVLEGEVGVARGVAVGDDAGVDGVDPPDAAAEEDASGNSSTE